MDLEISSFDVHQQTAVFQRQLSKSKIEEADKRILFEQDGVFVHLYVAYTDEDNISGGILRLVETNDGRFITWEKENVIPETCNKKKDNPENNEEQFISDIELVTATRKQEEMPNGSPVTDWTMVTDQPQSSENMHNIKENSEEETKLNDTSHLFNNLEINLPIKEISFIRKSKKIIGWDYLLIELSDGASIPALHFHKGGCKEFLKALEIYVHVTPSAKDDRKLVVSPLNANNLTQSFDELNLFGDQAEDADQIANRFLLDPISSTFSGFAKVTNFLQDVFNPGDLSQMQRPSHERGTVLSESEPPTGVAATTDATEGFEMITCARLKPRTDPSRGKALDEETWNSYLDTSGRVTEIDTIKHIIFQGGIESNLRKTVWKYLLEYYPWSMSTDELQDHVRDKEEDYYKMKLQWKSVSPQQEKRFTVLRDNRSLIEKDVERTDRKRMFYEGKGNISLKLLHDILMTYCMYNFDLGYVQGMSDLLSPILEVLESEVDAFWCFVGYMETVQHNFDVNQRGMKSQLRDLRVLLQLMEPKLWDHFESKESAELFFCFRWLLIRFKREFSFDDIQTLWEVLWTKLPCPNFHLFICMALLETEKEFILNEDYGFSDILKYINDLSGKIDLQTTLRKAEGIYNQLCECKQDLPDNVRRILNIDYTS